MALNELGILNGVLSLIVVFSSILMGIIVLFRYKKYKQKTFLYVGFTAIGIFSFWWPSSLSFLIAIFNGVGLEPFPSIYLFIMGLLSTPTMIFWMLALNSLMEKKNKWRKLLFIIISIESSIIEIIYLITAVVYPEDIGYLKSPVDVYFTVVGIILYVNLSIIIFFVTLSFSLNSMKSPVTEVRLKAYLILISGILFTICTFSDGILPLNIISLTIIRILLILSAFLMYCGFHLPNYVKKIFLK